MYSLPFGSRGSDAWKSIGSGGGINPAYGTWTGFNAFSGTNAGNNAETGNGTVKYAGVAMFSDALSDVDIEGILIAGGLVTP